MRSQYAGCARLQGAPSQVQYTLVPLVFRALGLARTIHAAELAEEERAERAKAALQAKAAKKAAGQAAEARGDGDEGGGHAGQSAETSGVNGSATMAKSSGEEADGGAEKGGGEESSGNAGQAGGASDAQEASREEASGGELVEGGAGGREDALAGSQAASRGQEEHEEEDEEEVEQPPARPRQFSSRKVYQFLHEIVTAMAPLHSWISLKLFLQCALGADQTGFKAIAYEFFSQVCACRDSADVTTPFPETAKEPCCEAFPFPALAERFCGDVRHAVGKEMLLIASVLEDRVEPSLVLLRGKCHCNGGCVHDAASTANLE